MPVNANESAALLDLAKSFTSSYEQRDRLSAALREHLGVTPRDSFYVSDDGTDDVLGPVVIYRLDRDCCDANGCGMKMNIPSTGDETAFRVTYARLGDGYTFGEPVKVRRVTAYEAVRDSDAGEGLDAGQDEAEVPEWLAGALARAASLTKGAGHRYIRRVPKSGGGYRYFYKVSGGGGLGHEDEMKVGAKFRVANGGKEGHFEIVGKDDKGNLRIKHDESGHESSVSPAALRSMLHAEHAQSLTAHREKLAADIKATDDPKAKAKLLAEAGKYEHTKDLAEAGKITNDLSSLKAGDLVRPHTPSGEPYGDTWAVQGRLADGRITIRNPEKGLTMVIDPTKPTDIRKIDGPEKPSTNVLAFPAKPAAHVGPQFSATPSPGVTAGSPEHAKWDGYDAGHRHATAQGSMSGQGRPAPVNPHAAGTPHAEAWDAGRKQGARDAGGAAREDADRPAPPPKKPAAPGDHTKIYNWGSTYEHPTARATQTAARTMTVGDRDYQLVPQPRPGKAPGFVANASMPGRAGSLDAKGNMTAEAPHVFDTAAEAHAAVVKHEAAQGAKLGSGLNEPRKGAVKAAEHEAQRAAHMKAAESLSGATIGSPDHKASVEHRDAARLHAAAAREWNGPYSAGTPEAASAKANAATKAITSPTPEKSGAKAKERDRSAAHSAKQPEPAKPAAESGKPPTTAERVAAEKRHREAAHRFSVKEKDARESGRKLEASSFRDTAAAHTAAADAHKNRAADAAEKTATAERLGSSSVPQADAHTRHAQEHGDAAERLEEQGMPMGSGSPHLAHMDAMRAHKRAAESYRMGDSDAGSVGHAAHAASRRAKEQDKSTGTRKSMSTVTDPERDLAKSLAASHRAAAEAQPDAGAKDAHEAAAQACDAAATADSTGDFRKALGAAERIGGLIKAWSGIPADQRRDFGAFAKSMQSPGGRLGDIRFAASNGTGDALGQMGRAFENARPPAEHIVHVAPEPTTYSPQRGAVNGMRKSMGSFYDRLSAGAAQQAVHGIRCPPEAKV